MHFVARKWRKLQVLFNLRFYIKLLPVNNKLPKKHICLMALFKVNSHLIKPESFDDIIKKADKLYYKKDYESAYQLLNKYKYSKNSIIACKTSKVLLKLSLQNIYSMEIQKGMLLEGIQLIENLIEVNKNDAELHKWLAILLNSYLKYISLDDKIKTIYKIKEHLMEAVKLNTNDKCVYYMLGYLYYQISSLSWFQRYFLSTFYISPPNCSMEESFNFFNKADELFPGSVTNIFMLGKTSVEMKQYFRAAYYFTLASKMIPKSKSERKYVMEALRLSKLLRDYELSKDALIFCT